MSSPEGRSKYNVARTKYNPPEFLSKRTSETASTIPDWRPHLPTRTESNPIHVRLNPEPTYTTDVKNTPPCPTARTNERLPLSASSSMHTIYPCLCPRIASSIQ